MERCDFENCTSQSYRHFWKRYFCNEHNWYLRVKASRESVTDLEAFISEHTVSK